MSNTVRRPRKRPRVKSCSFRTLGWLIRREAAWCILQHDPDSARNSRLCIRFLSWDNRQLASKINRTLLYVPHRRYYP